ncbi:hypothetical protein [Deinococcus aluminii]|uniref:Lipoprotein n=1 Tax=Deinococcus aluminii TaxID=1656885 RepID=A0ABP9XBC0_9DEIO
MNNLPRLVLLAGAALALTACGGSSPPRASDQPPVLVINGKVATWSGSGRVSVPDLLAVSAPVNADGTFALALPGEAVLMGRTTTASEVMTSLDCTGSLSSSAAGTRGFLLAVLNAQDVSGTRQVSAVEGIKTGALSRSVHARAWLYADGATQLRGTVDCAKLLNISQLNNLPVDVAVNTQRGWNVVDLTLNLSANIFGQVSGSGAAANSAAGTAPTTWRTMSELQAQLGF